MLCCVTFLRSRVYVRELVFSVRCVGRAYSGRQVEQIDIAATLAVLFAVPIPVNSLGVLIDEALVGLNMTSQLKAAYINAVQILRVARAGLADYQHSKSDEISTFSLGVRGMVFEVRSGSISVRFLT